MSPLPPQTSRGFEAALQGFRTLQGLGVHSARSGWPKKALSILSQLRDDLG